LHSEVEIQRYILLTVRQKLVSIRLALDSMRMESLTIGKTADLGVEDDQSAEYGVRHCQEMSIILQRLINDGNNLVFLKLRSLYNVQTVWVLYYIQFADAVDLLYYR